MRLAFILLPALTCLTLLPACGGLEDQELQLLDAYKNRAQIYYEAKRFEASRQQALLGLDLAPDDPVLNHTLGRALLEMRSLGKIVDARPFLIKAYDLKPDYRTAYSLAEFHQRYGVFLRDESIGIQQSLEAYPESDSEKRVSLEERSSKQETIAKEHWAEALTLLDVALTEAPEFLLGLQMAAMTHSLLGHDGIALEQLDRILSILAESKTYKNRQLATNTSLSLAQEQKIRADLLDDMGHEIGVRFARAAIFKSRNDLKTEELEYKFILQLNPRSPEAFFGLGMCLYEQGNLPSAKSNLKSFIKHSELDLESQYTKQAMRIIMESNDAATQ